MSSYTDLQFVREISLGVLDVIDVLFFRSGKYIVEIAVQKVKPLLLDLLVEECTTGILSHCEADHVAPFQHTQLALGRAVHVEKKRDPRVGGNSDQR